MLTRSSDQHAGAGPRRWVALSFVLVALGAAGCGSSSSTTTSSPAAPAETKSAPATPSEATKNGIPQGPNAGDRDGDNSGGPSDGDGNL